MRDLGLLTLRLTLGGLLAGHGSQKLFGLFEGGGPEGTGRFMEQLGLQPGKQWAITAGAGELVGGVLTSLGFLHPIGPLASMAPMLVAWRRAHGDKPIWVTSGGAELPLTNIAIAKALLLSGPGKYSLDHLLGVRLPLPLVVLAAGGIAAGVLRALAEPQSAPQAPAPPSEAEITSTI